MGEVILVALVVAGVALLVAVHSGVSILLGFVIKAIAPNVNRMLLASVASGLVPTGWFVFLLLVPVVAIDEEFRGPEVLGFAIILAIAIFLVVIVWPPSLFATYRFFRNR